jgi:hypothetical protein
LLDRVYKKLDTLLPKRNFLLHGETWDGQFKGKPKQPYRVGIIKKDLDYIDMFFAASTVPISSVWSSRAVTRKCQDITADLDTLRASKN